MVLAFVTIVFASILTFECASAKRKSKSLITGDAPSPKSLAKLVSQARKLSRAKAAARKLSVAGSSAKATSSARALSATTKPTKGATDNKNAEGRSLAFTDLSPFYNQAYNPYYPVEPIAYNYRYPHFADIVELDAPVVSAVKTSESSKVSSYNHGSSYNVGTPVKTVITFKKARKHFGVVPQYVYEPEVHIVNTVVNEPLEVVEPLKKKKKGKGKKILKEKLVEKLVEPVLAEKKEIVEEKLLEKVAVDPIKPLLGKKAIEKEVEVKDEIVVDSVAVDPIVEKGTLVDKEKIIKVVDEDEKIIKPIAAPEISKVVEDAIVAKEVKSEIATVQDPVVTADIAKSEIVNSEVAKIEPVIDPIISPASSEIVVNGPTVNPQSVTIGSLLGLGSSPATELVGTPESVPVINEPSALVQPPGARAQLKSDAIQTATQSDTPQTTAENVSAAPVEAKSAKSEPETNIAAPPTEARTGDADPKPSVGSDEAKSVAKSASAANEPEVSATRAAEPQQSGAVTTSGAQAEQPEARAASKSNDPIEPTSESSQQSEATSATDNTANDAKDADTIQPASGQSSQIPTATASVEQSDARSTGPEPSVSVTNNQQSDPEQQTKSAETSINPEQKQDARATRAGEPTGQVVAQTPKSDSNTNAADSTTSKSSDPEQSGSIENVPASSAIGAGDEQDARSTRPNVGLEQAVSQVETSAAQPATSATTTLEAGPAEQSNVGLVEPQNARATRNGAAPEEADPTKSTNPEQEGKAAAKQLGATAARAGEAVTQTGSAASGPSATFDASKQPAGIVLNGFQGARAASDEQDPSQINQSTDPSKSISGQSDSQSASTSARAKTAPESENLAKSASQDAVPTKSDDALTQENVAKKISPAEDQQDARATRAGQAVTQNGSAASGPSATFDASKQPQGIVLNGFQGARAASSAQDPSQVSQSPDPSESSSDKPDSESASSASAEATPESETSAKSASQDASPTKSDDASPQDTVEAKASQAEEQQEASAARAGEPTSDVPASEQNVGAVVAGSSPQQNAESVASSGQQLSATSASSTPEIQNAESARTAVPFEKAPRPLSSTLAEFLTGKPEAVPVIVEPTNLVQPPGARSQQPEQVGASIVLPQTSAKLASGKSGTGASDPLFGLPQGAQILSPAQTSDMGVEVGPIQLVPNGGRPAISAGSPVQSGVATSVAGITGQKARSSSSKDGPKIAIATSSAVPDLSARASSNSADNTVKITTANEPPSIEIPSQSATIGVGSGQDVGASANADASSSESSIDARSTPVGQSSQVALGVNGDNSLIGGLLNLAGSRSSPNSLLNIPILGAKSVDNINDIQARANIKTDGARSSKSSKSGARAGEKPVEIEIETEEVTNSVMDEVLARSKKKQEGGLAGLLKSNLNNGLSLPQNEMRVELPGLSTSPNLSAGAEGNALDIGKPISGAVEAGKTFISDVGMRTGAALREAINKPEASISLDASNIAKELERLKSAQDKGKAFEELSGILSKFIANMKVEA